jgi:REP element-mobilizing transposase RayT
MSRGNARQDIVVDDLDRQQFRERLAAQVARSRWEIISFVRMTNHFHLLIRTPIPNLAAGMQRFLSAHAKCMAVRHRRPGHLLQGRYQAELIEDDSYYWAVSRYIHLNPVRARLVTRPEDWPWSSFPGYLNPARRLSWIGYQRLWQAWRAEFGGSASDAIDDYGRYVSSGVERPPESPFAAMKQGWIPGSDPFVRRLKGELPVKPTPRGTPQAKALLQDRPEMTVDQVLLAVAAYYGLVPVDLSRAGAHAQARSITVWLCRRHTTSKLSVLSQRLGYARPECIPGIIRRVETWKGRDSQIPEDIVALERTLGVLKVRAAPDALDTERQTEGKVIG